MCLTRTANDKVVENKKPITTYKVMTRDALGRLLTPFMFIELKPKQLYAGKAGTKKFIAQAKRKSRLTCDGYHSYPTEQAAENCYHWARDNRYNSEEICLVKCEIPRWSGVARGKDDSGNACLASTRIIMLEVLKSDKPLI